MSRGYGAPSQWEHDMARDDAARAWKSSKRSADSVKQLRQVIVDMVKAVADDTETAEKLLQVVYEAGCDKHLLNRITKLL